MANYLFTLTISPVQSFIAQARKSQDLFAGSEILSQLMGKVLETFTVEERIFPQDEKAVSNKIVVKLSDKTEKQIKEIGEKLEKQINNDFLNAIFKETKCYDSALKDFFQVFWVAVELKENYQESYKQLERNLGAVKNLRTFSQNPQPSGKAKCVLCGERNQAKEDKEDNLCLICYTKRKCEINNMDKEKFPSLADIVTFDRKDKLNGQDAEDFLDTNPSEKKHYALLHFDVDSLGKTLSGLNEQGQKDLSTVLGDFAQKVGSEVLTSQKGRTVYAGGDDFLGFVNLASVFVVMQEIKDAFGEVKTSFPNLTFSTSIVIAHYKTPLHKVLDYSRELLEESKNHFDDKNALGIMVMSSNAVISKTICRYEDVALLQKMKEAEMAKNLHFKLAQIFDYLGEMRYDEFLTQKAMMTVEIKRLLKREEGSFDEKLYNDLIAFFGNQIKGDSYAIDFDNFIGFLKTLEQLRKVMP
ncbi:MAG: type III-B CRISPR-associated protein Cas10/Cmr2 [Sulfuricurvum sp.]